MVDFQACAFGSKGLCTAIAQLVAESAHADGHVGFDDKTQRSIFDAPDNKKRKIGDASQPRGGKTPQLVSEYRCIESRLVSLSVFLPL